MYLTLIPAYGRIHSSRAQAQTDWNTGADFRICGLAARNGTYCSVRDAQALREQGFTHVELHSGHATDRTLAVVKL
jgi:hypothetical protein